MKRGLFLALLALGLVVTTATACPKDGDGKEVKKDGGSTLVKATAGSPCSGTKTVAAATEDGRSDTGKAPCSSKKATSATLTSGCPCGKDCTKDCCKKDAKTVSLKKGKGCCSKKGKTVSAKDGGCPIAAKVKAVLASMPSMKYRVGDDVTGCSESAAGMAKKSGKPMEFMVGDEAFKSEGEAIVRLTALLEEEATSLQSIQYSAGGKCGRCPMTAKSIAKSTGTTVAYRVGGVDFESKENAEKVVKLVADAAKNVQMTYKVDGKSYNCSMTAGSKCKESGKTMTYVVGDNETGCQTSAKLMQAEAKIRKIVETATAASFSL